MRFGLIRGVVDGDEGADMIDTVIFDMDGTLIDTEKLAVRAWVKAGETLDLSLSEQQVLDLIIGRTKKDIIDSMSSLFGGYDTAQKLFDQHQVYREQLVDSELEPKPYAAECLDALKADGYKLGLATSSHRPTTDHCLELTNLTGRFVNLTCGEEVTHGKPDPETFLVAAERLGSDPSTCVVVEDSHNGVRAGHAAGMKVVMVPDLLPVTDEIEALCDAVIPSLAELEETVKALG